MTLVDGNQGFTENLTVEQCKKKIFYIGLKLGVSPKLISTKLLSMEDKDDMLRGLISDETLETAVSAWVASGMPDYANGFDSSIDYLCL